MKMRRTFTLIAMALTSVLIGACSEGSGQTQKKRKSKYSLALNGYNYTNQYIDSYSVNGTGGGNIYVSSPTSGGGGTTCCASFYPAIKNQTVHVKWQSGGCEYIAGRDSDGTIHWHTYPYFKETDAVVVDVSTGEPQNLEVHIYSDDKVEVYVTSEISLPRLKLEKDRRVTGNFPRCLNDKKPE